MYREIVYVGDLSVGDLVSAVTDDHLTHEVRHWDGFNLALWSFAAQSNSHLSGVDVEKIARYTKLTSSN